MPPSQPAGASVDRPRRRSDATVQSLVDAALDLFSERDFASVTVTDIARRAGVAHSLLYYHFKNKDDLFHSALTHLITRTMKDYEQLHERNVDPVSLLNDWFDINIKLSGPLRKLVKILFDYSGPQINSPPVDSAIEEFYRQERGTIARAIEKGIEEGVFAPVDVERVSAFISTHIDGIFFDSMLHQDSNIERSMETLKWATFRLLGHGEPE